MLTRQDLALIQAALKFFDEEMRPFDPKLLRHYFERQGDTRLQQDTVKQFRARLERCELRYLACNSAGTMTLDHYLRRSLKSAVAAARSRRHRLATVLLSQPA